MTLINRFTLVVELIGKGKYPSEIARELKTSRQSINKVIRVLKANGIIEKVGYGVWEITKKDVNLRHIYGSKKGLQVSPKNSNEIRGHAFQFLLILPRKLNNWEKKIKYLENNKISYKMVGNFNKIPRITLNNHKIWLCKDTIKVFFPSGLDFYSNSAKESNYNAINHFYSIVRQLERVLKVNFKIKGEYLFKITKQHYSLIKNEIANYYLDDNKKVEIRDEKGELWALIDNSYNLEELEAVHPKTAIKDTDRVLTPLMNTLRENPNILQDMILNITSNTKLLYATQEEISSLTKSVANIVSYLKEK